MEDCLIVTSDAEHLDRVIAIIVISPNKMLCEVNLEIHITPNDWETIVFHILDEFLGCYKMT